jgi:hypothetical protein
MGVRIVILASIGAGCGGGAGNPAQGAPPITSISIDSLGAGEWLELPNTKIRSVLPTTPQRGDPVNIVEAWSGGAVDPLRSRVLIWGGGHNDYWGNEVYALDLDTFSMDRIVDPSPTTAQSNCSSSLPDGTPVSRHTYGGMSYISHADRLFSVGGSMAPCGSADMVTWTYDFSSRRWEALNTSPLGVDFGFMAAYDAQTRSVLVKDRTDFYAYSLETNQYTKLNSESQDVSLYLSAALDTKRRQFVMVGDGMVKMIDLTTYRMTTVTTSNPPAALSTPSPGVAYDPGADRIVVWSGGSDVFTLDMESKGWKQVATNHGPSDPASAQGTFGRWGYVPQYGVIALVNGIDQNAWVFRVAR